MVASEMGWVSGAARYGNRVIRNSWGLLLPLACVALALIYAPIFSDYMVPKIAALHIIGSLVVGLWLANGFFSARLRVPRQDWLLPLAVYLALVLVSLGQATNIWQGVEVLLFQCWIFALALAVAAYYRTRAPWALLLTITATALLVAIIGVFQYAGIHLIPMPHERFGNLGVSTLGNPNFVAHYLELAILLTLGLLLACQKTWQRGALVLALAFLGYYMLLTQSRGGWIALFCGLTFFAWRLRREIWRRIPWPAVVLVVVLAWPLAELTLGAFPGENGKPNPYGQLVGLLERVAARVATMADMQHISIIQRRLIWSDTMALIKDHALWGVGVGNYEFALPAYRTVGRHREWQQYIGHLPHMPYYAHNEYLEIWAESGGLALIVWLWLLFTIVRAGWREASSRSSVAESAMVWAALSALVAALVHAFFSLNLQDPTSALHFAVAVGLISALSNRSAKAVVWKLKRWSRTLIAVLSLAFIALGGYLGVCILLGDYYYFAGQKKHFDAKQPNRAYLAFAKAVDWRGHEFRHQHMLGLVALETRRLADAEAALRRSDDLHPNNVAALRLLGRTLYWLNKGAEATEILQRAIALDPLHAETYAWLARALQLEGRAAGDDRLSFFLRSAEAWRQALAFAPENADYLRGLGLALSEAELLDQAANILVQSVRLHPEDGVAQGNLGAIYLRQGKWDAAEEALLKATVVDAHRAQWWGNLSELYIHQGFLEKGEDALRNAVDADPSDLRWHLILAEVLLREKKLEAALAAALQALQHHPENEVLTQLAQDLLQRRQKGEE